MSPRQAARECWAVVAPGLEALTAAELRTLGLAVGEPEPGGVPFRASDAELFAANLWLRTASRVLVRVASFRATAFRELERRALGVPWESFVPPAAAVRLSVTCRKSRLYHSGGVAERVAGAIAKRVPLVTISRSGRGDDDAERARPPQLFLVRFLHDACTISADSSGALLHRRGYRLATAKAPLRETLAAATLLALGWDGRRPLLDPMCGSGTIAIEGALLARGIAPGLARTFACEEWPDAPATECAAQRDRARSEQHLRAATLIVASDRDEGAVAAARANALRAGVENDVEIRHCALSAIAPPADAGLLLTNPPYGARVGERTALRNLYAQLGNVARATCAGWTLAFLAADRALAAQVKLPLEDVLRFRHGGTPVRLVRAHVASRA